MVVGVWGGVLGGHCNSGVAACLEMKEGVPCLVGKGWMWGWWGRWGAGGGGGGVGVCVCVGGGGLLVELLIVGLSCNTIHLQGDVLGHRKWCANNTTTKNKSERMNE